MFHKLEEHKIKERKKNYLLTERNLQHNQAHRGTDISRDWLGPEIINN